MSHLLPSPWLRMYKTVEEYLGYLSTIFSKYVFTCRWLLLVRRVCLSMDTLCSIINLSRNTLVYAVIACQRTASSKPRLAVIWSDYLSKEYPVLCGGYLLKEYPTVCRDLLSKTSCRILWLASKEYLYVWLPVKEFPIVCHGCMPSDSLLCTCYDNLSQNTLFCVLLPAKVHLWYAVITCQRIPCCMLWLPLNKYLVCHYYLSKNILLATLTCHGIPCMLERLVKEDAICCDHLLCKDTVLASRKMFFCVTWLPVKGYPSHKLISLGKLTWTACRPISS